MTSEVDYETKKEQEHEAHLVAVREEAVSKAKYQATYVMQELAREYGNRVSGSGYGSSKLETENERVTYRAVLYQEFFDAISRERERLGITRLSSAGAI
jgi:hypothetical protein